MPSLRPLLLDRLLWPTLIVVSQYLALQALAANLLGVALERPLPAADLAALIARTLEPGARLLHLAGVARTHGFAEALEHGGFPLDVVEIYDARKVSYATDFLENTFSQGALWGALVLSSRAGVLLAEITGLATSQQAFEKTMFFCISEKTAAPLRGLGLGQVAVSAEPTEEAVLRLLSSQG